MKNFIFDSAFDMNFNKGKIPLMRVNPSFALFLGKIMSNVCTIRHFKNSDFDASDYPRSGTSRKF